jgi:hypothetical protein
VSLSPVEVMEEIDSGAARLNALERGLSAATGALDDAEANWLECYDAMADALKAEMDEAGRKGDPAEHWIESRARKENRTAFGNYRRAKNLVGRLEKQMKARQTVVSARQTQLNALRDEGRGSYQPQPSGPIVGGRRAT